MSSNESRASWSGQLAFVLAASASAVGIGNMWRFPYLVAQYGGGTFILVYVLLVAMLGFALMVTEIAIGRKTEQSPLTAFTRLNRRWGFLGVLSVIVPLLIVPYYSVIGGWVLKYFVAYCRMAVTGEELMGANAADAGAFFQGFISTGLAPFGYALVFIAASAAVILMGVKNGIERSNMVMMPLLIMLTLCLSIYILSIPGSLAGVKYYLVPSMDALRDAGGSFSLAQLGKTLLGATGQMFFSLSLAMGIMVTYGSYMRKEDSIERCVRRIEIFDTLIAVLAGLMIVPVVYMFAAKTGTPIKEAMGAGPGLMFITLPKVFAMLGSAGAWVGVAFFVLVVFAALTSAISMIEGCVASLTDFFGMRRNPATVLVIAATALLASFSALGYGVWGSMRLFGMQCLDFFDFVSNSVMMPVVAIATCIFAGWVLKPNTIEDEVERGGHPFKSRRLYRFMVKYFAPVLLISILVSEIFRTLGIAGWKI